MLLLMNKLLPEVAALLVLYAMVMISLQLYDQDESGFPSGEASKSSLRVAISGTNPAKLSSFSMSPSTY